ncbi:glycosyltransferase [Paenibacillus amylolyticus]|nr:glycosyltransferase [Paenibacillus amylolyticus]
MVEVFRQVQEQVPAKLLFVGEGPDLPKMQWKINDLGLNDKVHFLGKQDDIAQVISMADVLMLPSEKESFGLVALEAMACGVPTIGSQAGGIPNWSYTVRQDSYPRSGDTQSMAENTIRLLTDDRLAAEFREACLQRAHHDFAMMPFGMNMNRFITGCWEEKFRT